MTDTSDIRPFRIDIPQADLDDLNLRLANARWPEELPEVGWEYGIPTHHLRELSEYWRDSYDWRANEADLNRYPQFIATIGEQTVHFTHVISANPDAQALVLIHGWPFADFRNVIEPLTDDFHLVIPTLPGFGFSGQTNRVGDASTESYAVVLAELMSLLGYSTYGAHGGDAGSFVAPQLGRIDPEHVVGVHLNGPITIPSWDDDGVGYSDEDQAKLAKLKDWSSSQTSGYAGMHSTRPQTLAPALNDSPVGLLGWIADVVHTFANEPIDRDALLTNVCLLWFTSTVGSSMRLYKESGQWGAAMPSSGVPTAIALFKGDSTIRGIAEKQNRVVRWTQFDRGGHFAALEAPDLLATDIHEFFATLR
ncbi:epoxide hydrolase family protein [Antrihabitans cavernicola]|uniref:Epoxide hydrolase n=1 Tax=Antrihabitans cavernicola TaxID=2495913 RepID=A0A5A7SFG4_9NOCA|nr:epoxide hydrolase family protein [Spelaeibacter cavernicola]KAA0024870.1 epoxide hydrolase [Spelaeibacter cavernicola]